MSSEFSDVDVVDLLGALDDRLRARGVAAAIFVVGGAAVAVRGVRLRRVTQDIDAFASTGVVLEEARKIADERGLPPEWFNSAARMWMPDLPQGALDPPPVPGLRVTYADDDFLLATKLVAQRRQDADDIRALADRTGLLGAPPERLLAHVRRFYTDDGSLELILGVRDVEAELQLLAQDAARLLAQPD